MAKTMTLSYRMPGGGAYKIEYRRTRDGRKGPSYYRMRVIEHPPCNNPLGAPSPLHGDFISVPDEFRPQTIERAKFIAVYWIKDFEAYRLSGGFPNGQPRFDGKGVQHLLNDTAS